MARPIRIQYPGAFYHVFSRGNERKDIFFTDDDRSLFLAALKESAIRFGVIIHSFCLMPNHIHLLIETKSLGLSKFMKYLLGVYAIRFNRTHKRVGHLFQGRYKAYLVEKDSYLLELSRYIHLNPVKAGISSAPEDYPWSSMKYFLTCETLPYLDRSLILGFFESSEKYRLFVLEGLKEMANPFKDLIGGAILGSKEFADQFKAMVRKEEGIAGKRELLGLPLDTLSEILEFEDYDFKIYSLWASGKMTQKEIGNIFKKTDSAISHSIRRFTKKLNEDSSLKAKVDTIGEVISSFKN